MMVLIRPFNLATTRASICRLRGVVDTMILSDDYPFRALVVAFIFACFLSSAAIALEGTDKLTLNLPVFTS